MRKWSADELRNIYGQIEYVIREAFRKEGRLSKPKQIDEVDE